MSRTYKDMPLRVLINKRAQSWRFETSKYLWTWGERGGIEDRDWVSFPPAHTNNAWRGIGEWCNYWERKERARVRDELKKGNDPGGYKHKHRAKWDVW